MKIKFFGELEIPEEFFTFLENLVKENTTPEPEPPTPPEPPPPTEPPRILDYEHRTYFEFINANLLNGSSTPLQTMYEPPFWKLQFVDDGVQLCVDASTPPFDKRIRAELKELTGSPYRFSDTSQVYEIQFAIDMLPKLYGPITIFQRFNNTLKGPDIEVELTGADQHEGVSANTVQVVAFGKRMVLTNTYLKEINHLKIAIYNSENGTYAVSLNGRILASGNANTYNSEEGSWVQFGLYPHGWQNESNRTRQVNSREHIVCGTWEYYRSISFKGKYKPEDLTTQDYNDKTPVIVTVNENILSKIGVTGGPIWDSLNLENHPARIFGKGGRMFYLKEKDHLVNGEYVDPKDMDYVPSIGSLEEIDWRLPIADNKYRIIRNKEKLKELTISPEVIVWRYPKKFPHKDFTSDELGLSIAEIESSAFRWASMIFQSVGEYIDVFELGNEPWGYSKEVWAAVQKGYVRAAIENDFQGKLSTAAMPVGVAKNFWKGTLDDFVPESIRDQISIVSYHSYPFTDMSGTSLDINSPRVLQDTDEILAWTSKNMPHATVRLTETGYPTYLGGEEIQLQFLTNTIEAVIDKGVEAVFIYQLLDRPEMSEGIYNETGILNADKTAKKAYKHFLNMYTGDL